MVLLVLIMFLGTFWVRCMIAMPFKMLFSHGGAYPLLFAEEPEVRQPVDLCLEQGSSRGFRSACSRPMEEV